MNNGYTPPADEIDVERPLLNTKTRLQLDESTRMPSLMFIENVGQFDSQARFQVRGAGGLSYLTPDAIWMTYLEPLPDELRNERFSSDSQTLSSPRNGVNLRLSFVGANNNPQMIGFKSLNTNFSYYIGNDPVRWHTNVPVWGGVRYVDIYPGVDIEISSEGSQWRWEIIAADESSLEQVVLQVEGADELVNEGDYIVASTAFTDISIPYLKVVNISKPEWALPVLNGNRINLPYANTEERMTTNQNRGEVTGLMYSMIVGGTDIDGGLGIVADNDGNAYVTGYTCSQDFPGVLGTGIFLCNIDAFVLKIPATGNGIIYYNIFGGDQQDKAYGIDIDPSGNAYITGETYSYDFATLNPYQGVRSDIWLDAFVVKFNPDGEMVFSTYIGGTGRDIGYQIKVDAEGSIYVTGSTTSNDLDTTENAIYPDPPDPNGTDSDAFVIQFTPDGQSYVFFTYLGGTNDDVGWGITIDPDSNVYIAGWTNSTDFPVERAYQSTPGGNEDAFLTVLCAGGLCEDPDLPYYSSYIYEEDNYAEYGYDIDIDNSDQVYITGSSENQIFLGKFDASMSGDDSKIYITSFGGSDDDEAYGIATALNGYVYIGGDTYSSDFPVTSDAVYPYYYGYGDAVLVKLDSTGSIVYATYLGGSDNDYGNDVATDVREGVYVTGETWSDDFPITYGEPPGESDSNAFVTKFSSVLRIPEESTRDSGSGGMCPTYKYTQKYGADPINTRTGGYDQSATDLSIQTVAGPLELQRWYSSLATDTYTTTMGYGWTNNLQSRLIFPDDPGGEDGMVLFKSQSTNVYDFYIDGTYTDPYTGTFTAYLGLCGELISLMYGENLTGYAIKDSAQRTFTFDPDGRLLSWKDAQRHIILYTYDTQNPEKLVQVTGPDNEFISLSYSDPNHPNRLTGAEAGVGTSTKQVSYIYDNDNLTAASDVLTHTWQYIYGDPNYPHLLTKVIDPDGKTVERTVYDPQGRAIAQYNGEDNLVMGLNYLDSRTTEVYDTVGITTTHLYDYRSTVTDIEDPLGGITSREYDDNFRPTAITDPRTNTTYLTWSADGVNLTQTVQILNSGQPLTTTMGYDDLNNLTKIIDGRGFTTTYNYSGTLMISSIDAIGNTTLLTYTTSADGVPSGLLKDVQDPERHHTRYTYYTSGKVHTITDALENVITYTYDDFGNLQSITNESIGRVDWTCHDAAGRVWRTINNLSPNPPIDPCSDQFVPGADPEYDRMHDSIFDTRGNVIASIEWAIVDSQVVSYTTRTYYNDAGRVTDVVQNLRGQSISNPNPPNYNQDYPDQNIKNSTVYNDDSTVKEAIDNAGNITYYCYDQLNRVVKTIDNPTVPDPCIQYTPTSNADQDVINQTIYDESGNVIATIDPGGRVTRTYYDNLNRPVIVVQNFTGNIQDPPPPPGWTSDHPDQNIRTDTLYDNNGNVQRTTDNDNRITHYCYDKSNRLIKTVVNLSDPNDDPCDPSFDPSSEADQDITTSIVYDGNGNAIETIDPLGVVTRTYYDALNRPTLVVRNFTGNLLDPPPECNRDSTGELEPINICEETVYDDVGNAIAMIDPLGRITRTYYDSLNRPYMVIRNLTVQGYEDPDLPDPSSFGNDENVAVETRYDERGRTIATIEYWAENGQSKSRVTRTYFDDLGRQEWVVRNLVGQEIEDPEPPATWNNSENIKVKTAFDAHGDAIIKIEYLTDADEQPFTRTNRTYFNRLGRLDLVVSNLDPTIDPFSPAHPTCNRDTTGTVTPFNICYETIYVRSGEAIALIEPLGHITRTYYDGLSRQVTIVANLTGWDVSNPSAPPRNPSVLDINIRTDMSYDRAGNRNKVVDPNGISTAYEYDDLNRLNAVVENYQNGVTPTVDINVRTEYTYDKRGSLLTIRDANAVLGNLQYYTIYGYDDLARQITEIDPLMHEWTYAYDVQGNQVQMTDANGVVTDYSVDGLDRLNAIDYPSPDGTVTYTYNALGWRMAMTDGVGSTGWQYDPLGRITAVTDPFDSEINYAYDASGNRTEIIYPDQKTVTYLYDSLGRLSQTIDWDTQTTTNKYNVAGNTVAVNYPSGVTTSYTYDRIQRLVEQKYSTTNGTLSYFDYKYDPVGNRVSQTERVRQPNEPLDAIFADGFESGDFAHWSAHTTSNDLLVGNIASIVDTYGMKVTINDGDTLAVTDDTPDNESHYFARFYFDPNSIRMSSGDAHQIFQGYTELAGFGLIIKIQLRKSGSLYYIDAYIRTDNGSWALPLATSLSDTYHAIEIEWKASSSPSTSNGYLKLWVDGTPKGTRSSIDNDTHRLGQSKMGTLSTPNSGTRGWYCFDAFASRREANLGTVAGVHGCGGTDMMGGSMLDSSLAIPLTITLPYSGELPISDTVPLGDIIPINDETVVLTVTMPYTDEIPLTNTIPITGGLAVLPDTLVITDDIPIELNQAVLTVTLPVTQSLVSDEGFTVVMTETIEITVTGVISNTLIGSTLNFFPVAPPSSGTTTLAESGWSHVIVINYTYDPLNRLHQAAYNIGRQFDYTYDAVGNRLTQSVDPGPGNPVVTNYQYDYANRLTYVNSQAYSWDNNGNMLNDGTGTYTYNHANRLASVSATGQPTIGFRYNGLGDRLEQTIDMNWTRYTVDLAGGLTQVLSDGTRTYLYGEGRIGEKQPAGWQYYTNDGLGSLRQLTDNTGAVTLAKGYEPYGEVLDSAGSSTSSFGYTGEWTDSTGLVYLRARYYDPMVGRFVTGDTWGGDMNQPMSYNAWLYTFANPINLTDPTGQSPFLPPTCVTGTAGLCVDTARLQYSKNGPILLAGVLWGGRFDCNNT
ncbi:MAG: SBBP repeat-containing protein, partial [Anaerolineales bacterium]